VSVSTLRARFPPTGLTIQRRMTGARRAHQRPWWRYPYCQTYDYVCGAHPPVRMQHRVAVSRHGARLQPGQHRGARMVVSALGLVAVRLWPARGDAAEWSCGQRPLVQLQGTEAWTCSMVTMLLHFAHDSGRVLLPVATSTCDPYMCVYAHRIKQLRRRA
jgi:hypothetical protein